MRRFVMYRRDLEAVSETHDENQMNDPSDVQFEGVEFSDGKVAIRWLTACRSVSVWDSMDDMLAIHGHPEYGSELIWMDEPEYAPDPHLCVGTSSEGKASPLCKYCEFDSDCPYVEVWSL